MAKQLLMKIHAKYEPSFCISLQVIVIPHYSYHSEVYIGIDIQAKISIVAFDSGGK
mgnify:CR=1 FL=1